MNKLSILKRKLKNKDPILSTTISNIAWSGLIQKASAFSFDFMVFDTEHGTLSVDGLDEMLRMCRFCDLPSIVRLPDCIPSVISKALDMGADGLLVPRVESLAQVETTIRAARYFPRGRKGCGGFSNFRNDDYGKVEQYNDNRLIFIQVESPEGMSVLPSILESYGEELAGVIIGPYDSSIMLGTPLEIESDAMTNYIKKIFSICHDAGISCGSFVDNGDMIARYRDLGGNIFWIGTEISLLCESFTNVCNAFQKEMIGF